MLKQCVSVSDADRPDAVSTALSPLPSRDGIWVVDHDLKARLMRAAAASGLPSPVVVPGAAVLLLALDLPLKSRRKRQLAARYAAEPFLTEDLEDMHVTVGPSMQDTTRLCAAANGRDLDRWASSAEVTGVALPDLCAVPMPADPKAWSLWCSLDAIYLRTADGAGCVFAIEAFANIWRAYDRPPLELWFGVPPPGLEIARRHDTLPDVPASVFELDMRRHGASQFAKWRSRLGFAVGVSVMAGVAHAAMIVADASALDQTAAKRRADLIDHAARRGASLDVDAALPTLSTDLANQAFQGGRTDPFLDLLARTGSALAGSADVAFRDLQYDAGTGTMTVLLTAPDLAAVQRAESALRASGMTVTGGAASATASGAEMQVLLSEGG